MRKFSAFACAGMAGLLSLTAVAARSDDWPQIRRDSSRSGASLDPVKFPLTDVWTWETVDLENHSPLSHVSVWKDAAYFIAGDGPSRLVVCADAKSGAVRWKQRLTSTRIPHPYSDFAGPAVSLSGKVFTYDWQAGKLPPVYSVFSRRVPRGRIASHMAEIQGFQIRALDARDGRLLDFLPLGGLGVAGPPPILSLVHNPHPTGLHPQAPRRFPAPPWRDIFEKQYLGQPLLNGDELTATGFHDLFVKWTPGGYAQFSLLNHPLVGQDPDATPPSEFHGYPPVAVGGGTLVAEGQTHRFMALLNGTTASRWQRDLNTSIGPASADNEAIFVGLGGGNANRALACIDSGSGQVRWMYAPQGLPPERQGIQDRVVTRLGRKLVVLGEEPVKPPRTTEELKAFTERLLRQGIMTEIQPESLSVKQPYSLGPLGHLNGVNPVVSEGRAFADVALTVTALDQRTGSVLWRQPVADGMRDIRSLAATREHLLVTYIRAANPSAPAPTDPPLHFLAALRKDTGKVVWQVQSPLAGTVSLAGGLVYHANGTLTALAPAERTYRLAADSDDPKAYAEGPFHTTALLTEGGEGANAASTLPAAPVLPPEVRGDASVLRLSLDRPVEELVSRARERRARIGLLPLTLRLDSLNTTRSALLGAGALRWTPERIEAITALCGRLVEAAQPHHLDVAPEFNVYLRHHPEEGPAVLRLFQRVTEAAHAAAPGCRVVASVDVEVLSGLYGQGRVLPYGELPKLKRGESPTPPELAQIARVADAIGLTSHPQSAYRLPKEMLGDHLFRVRHSVGETKPLVVLGGTVHIDTQALPDQVRQASFAQRLLRACYWLNAEVVVPPRITLDPEVERANAATGVEPAKLEAERWRQALRFERVGQLTVAPPTLRPSWDSPVESR